MASRGVVLFWSTFCAAVLLCALLTFHMWHLMQLLYRSSWDARGDLLYASVDDNEARMERIKSFCEAHRSWLRLHHPNPGLGINLPSPTNKKMQCYPTVCPLFVDDSRSLAFCFIAKVASTSLKALFAPLLNVTIIGTQSDALHWSFHYQTLRYGPATLSHSTKSNYTKVLHSYASTFSTYRIPTPAEPSHAQALFVRHPFERLVSTYIDKALRGRSEMEWAYNIYWDKIPGVRAENRSPTFSEFADFVLGMPVEQSDEHWAPYYFRCQPCLLDYDFVGKLETASRDFPRFFSLVGIEASGSVSGHMSHENTRNNVSGVQATDSKHYFADLSFEQVMGLYARYFYDFELFGYDFRDYLP